MKKIRKQWLISFLILFSIIYLLDIYATIINDSEGQYKPEIGLIILPIWAWIIYYCAYKKQGTKLLIWIRIGLAMAVFRNFQDISRTIYIVFHPDLNISNQDLVLSCLEVVPLMAGEIWFWINCIRLREENLRLKDVQKSLKVPAIPEPPQFF